MCIAVNTTLRVDFVTVGLSSCILYTNSYETIFGRNIAAKLSNDDKYRLVILTAASS